MATPKQRKTTPTPTPKMISFDDDGDLTLLVGIEKHEFRVDSHGVCRASPVFKRMLNGGFSESRTSKRADEAWTVQLPDDLPWAVEHILYIIHYQFSRLPTSLDDSHLHDILVFTEKYDMTEIIRPWIWSWMPAWSDLVQSKFYYRVLGIAWELGAEDILDHVGKMLVQNCETDEHGNLAYPDNSGLDNQSALSLVPPGFLDSVASTRRALIMQIFANLSGLINKLSKLCKHPLKLGTYCQAPVSAGSKSREACYAMSLGAIMGKLGKVELESIWDYRDTPREVSYPYSVSRLIAALKDIPDDLHRDSVFNDHRHSEACSPLPGFISKIQSLVDSQSSTLTKQQILYMAEQRKRLGVEWKKPVEAKPVIKEMPEVKTTNEIYGYGFLFGTPAGFGAPARSSSMFGACERKPAFGAPAGPFRATPAPTASGTSGLFGGFQGPAASGGNQSYGNLGSGSG